ncbi:MAG: hypothetical protein EU539_05750 [Promethearchaeota archaeon]|nr:MAG: hypothetical protein EU539_05750 [Candidatus Lokiarchaeota archaeon]
MKSTSMINEKFEFKCVQCGECCRAGFKVTIKKEDVKLWKELEKSEILEHLKLDPECISLKEFNYHMDKDGSAVMKSKMLTNSNNLNVKLNNLVDFIHKKHDYQGSGSYPLDYFTIIPNMRNNPILIPKSYEIILEGMKLGLNYIINLDSRGFCPFLKLNSCIIHEFKPFDCKRFPFGYNGNLRNDNYFLALCKGLKRKNSNEL